MNRIWIILFTALGGIVASMIGFVIYMSPPRFIREWSLPAYAKNLPENAASAEFNERVQAKFPSPIKEQSIIDTLTTEGFDQRRGQRIYQIQRSAFPCLYTWTIRWTPDPEGLATDLRGTYDEGCL